jgi:acyl-CoA thioester hydrolase
VLSETFKVRFYETDALRHVNNTVVPQWFETAREPIFKLFNPDLNLEQWPLILASYTVDFIAQIHYGLDVTVKTGIRRVGNSSFVVAQEVWQAEQLVAKGETTLVHYDFVTQKSCAIPLDIKQQLTRYLI